MAKVLNKGLRMSFGHTKIMAAGHARTVVTQDTSKGPAYHGSSW